MRAIHFAFATALALASSAAAQSTPGAASQPGATNCTRAESSRTAPSPAIIAARHAQHQACAADMARFCGDVPRGCGRPMQCLRAHTASLSSACTGAMAQLHAARMQSH